MNNISDKQEMLNVINSGKSTWSELLKKADDLLKDDFDIVLSAINKHPLNLEFASSRLRDNNEIVSFASSHWVWCSWSPVKLGEAFRFASDRLKNDRDFILTNLKYSTFGKFRFSNYTLFQYLPFSLRSDVEIVNKCIEIQGGILAFISDELKQNLIVTKLLVMKDINRANWRPESFESANISDVLRFDKEILSAASTRYYKLLDSKANLIKNNKETESEFNSTLDDFLQWINSPNYAESFAEQIKKYNRGEL